MEMMQGECFAMPVPSEKGADQKNQIQQIESLHSKGKVGVGFKAEFCPSNIGGEHPSFEVNRIQHD